MSTVVLQIASPFVTIKKYAEMIGVSTGSVEAKIKGGHLPTIKQGKNRLINVAKLTQMALEAE